MEQLKHKDAVLGQKPFIHDEVRYNLIHRISESEDSLCLTDADGKLIYAGSKGNDPWLWIAEALPQERKASLVRDLIQTLDCGSLPGITGAPDTAALFAEQYASRYDANIKLFMRMESYTCPEVKPPSEVAGAMRRAEPDDIVVISEFLAGFSAGAYGVHVDPQSQIAAAEERIEKGDLQVWVVKDKPVSMANVAHRSPRHARINAVYTPAELRGHGYASAVVAGLCSIVKDDGLTPMLYADLSNPHANNVYRNIGFIEAGTIDSLKFEY
ncbi:GNAT family N-acetyltransferase [Paenibacillus pasadenensis]|uniref:GNAT family N-acetyltransferase n=1 Tax=Paenibacillus pasadenensis TaxID=217090 RepID=UPI00204201C3|nr:GNAT family N-acetyltransferase [Paenibacillus pasadenensis]MCM3749496.1 GNAT family N-acetyltransferase [Paenibacillus pasadenensis]